MARYRSPKHTVTTKALTVIKKRIKTVDIPLVRAKLQKKQNNRCLICQRDLRRLRAVLDHCHTTGFIRGVLCNNCNGIEGKISGLLNRLDVGKIGFDQVIINMASLRHPDNLKKKWVHPHAETLVEQKTRRLKRAKKLRSK
tara:strand:+ start:25507 stop:25929 length:423 start_codon:yes stop_codon:yes gene_type:complete